MAERRYESWGRYPKATHQVVRYHWRNQGLPLKAIGQRQFLPYGNGRSYGDVCLNNGGALLDCRNLDHFLAFDPTTGLLRCEAGVLLAEILELAVPQGWFLPVSPGTQYVTVGGAIASDVHGKNHHRAGTFGRYLRCFELLRSDGTRLLCSAQENQDYFAATVAGLGMTGVVTWAEIQLKPIRTPFIAQESIRYQSLDEFFTLARESDGSHEYTVAWIDCLAKGKALGRGLFMRGNHADEVAGKRPRAPGKTLRLRFDPPFALVNGVTLKALNTLYYHKQRAEQVRATVHYQPFFYPLDAVRSWNRMYGRKGFFQYQCAIPTNHADDAIQAMLARIASAGAGSFLAVLKMFGNVPSPGLLSFPLPGATLALDFPNAGRATLDLLCQLDDISRAAGGRVYPSKDARMTAADFQRNYAAWRQVEALRDPAICSDFWRRVTAKQ